jgi:hypothetical protein
VPDFGDWFDCAAKGGNCLQTGCGFFQKKVVAERASFSVIGAYFRPAQAELGRAPPLVGELTSKKL